MNRQHLLFVLIRVGQTVLRFAGYGAGIAAGAGLMIIMITTRIGEDSPVNNTRFIEVVINYAIVGALAGGIIGLVYGIIEQRR